MWRTKSQWLARQVTSQPWRAASTSKKTVLAIRREDNSVWERRAPLAPVHVKKLVEDGVKVLVQASNRRAYSMQEYARAGAEITEEISDAEVIIGVKPVPVDLLEPYKTYAFFSHTIKAQEANMPLLDAILEKNIRLIDYEKMNDANGRRVVAFGQYAGVAGMINILNGLGVRLLALGHHTPFMHIGPAHNYRNSGMARQAIRDAGYEISLGLMPKSVGPLVFVFTGSGNVSQGAQEVFQELPHEYVEPEHLPQVSRHGSLDKVYFTIIRRKDHLVRKEGGGYDKTEYMANPEKYASTFSKKIAPYATCVINGIYWAPNSPRLISIPDAKTLLRAQKTPWLPQSEGCPHLPHRMLAICDISADPGGSIEFMKECTTIDKPFCLYDAEDHMNSEEFAGDGVLICSVDNMPAQIPREATDFFGSLLLPYIHEILSSNANSPFEDYNVSPTVKDAVITSNGVLTDNFKYIDDLRKANREKSIATRTAKESPHNVLILGAGFVSAPVVDYLTRGSKIAVTVAGEKKGEIDALAQKFKNTTPQLLEVERSKDDLDAMIKDHDLVISLLPYGLHPKIAELCIKNRTNMVTASYRTPAMMELHQKARDAGITVVNEVGLDPGIDHMLAMELFDEIKEHGGKVTSFESYCGGLPAPESSDNPLRYKFSWSPRGVLLNVMAGAKYLRDGKIVNVKEGELLNETSSKDYFPGFNLEGFPNRDSTIYGDLYDINSASTIIRGTLRYNGFSEAMKALVDIGLIDLTSHAVLHAGGPDLTWRSFMCELMGLKRDVLVDSLRDKVFEKVGRSNARLQCIEGLGLLDEQLLVKKESPVDTLIHYLSNRLAFDENERDLIVLRHDVGVQWPDHSTETKHVDLVVYGEPGGYSAMAKTVGFPTGIAAKMVLEGEIQSKGMVVPLSTEMYRPILKRLKQEGIIAKDHSTIH